MTGVCAFETCGDVSSRRGADIPSLAALKNVRVWNLWSCGTGLKASLVVVGQNAEAARAVMFVFGTPMTPPTYGECHRPFMAGPEAPGQPSIMCFVAHALRKPLCREGNGRAGGVLVRGAHREPCPCSCHPESPEVHEEPNRPH